MIMKLELVPVPVTDVNRAKAFYMEKLGFHEDIDQTLEDGRRFIQLTPPASACSISIGRGVTKQEPGSIDGLILVVNDIKIAHDELVKRGVDISDPAVMPWGATHAELRDPDGNHWTIQQPTGRLQQAAQHN
jgi:uncharacterized glyoxalase superfamily protein PhnB